MSSSYKFDDFFSNKTLNKVHGLPDTQGLQKVSKKFKRNTRAVITPLGGGQYGRLFLVLSDTECNLLHGAVSVVVPMDPGPFTLAGRMSAAVISMVEKAHVTNIVNYYKFQVLKCILKNRLIEAFNPVYFNSIP